jgi:protein-disulfide isomerase
MARDPKARRAQQKARGMKPFYYALVAIALAGGGLLAMSVFRGGGSAATEAPAELQPITSSAELLQKARGVTRGVNTAPVKIMVFSDYMCPWCAVYATTIENQVRETFIDNGKAVEVYYDFPLGGAHVHSFLAARAARCAEDQGKFWEYHDTLFSKQRDWSYEKTPPTDMFIGYADDLGLDHKAFTSCLESDKHADLVEWNRQMGSEAGVNSTPSVFINGRAAESPLDFDKLSAEINAALGTAQ